jgi:hypothetical protein
MIPAGYQLTGKRSLFLPGARPTLAIVTHAPLTFNLTTSAD